ncbi:MAG: hypothetical protein ACXVA9_08675 [Bdellovibrionales bacterium]
MRFVLALFLLLPLAQLVGAEERESGQMDLSSNWAREKGAEAMSQERSRADFFLKSFDNREITKNPTVPTDESTATGTH